MSYGNPRISREELQQRDALADLDRSIAGSCATRCEWIRAAAHLAAAGITPDEMPQLIAEYNGVSDETPEERNRALEVT